MRVAEVLSVGSSAEEVVLSWPGPFWGWGEFRVPGLVPFPTAHQSHPVSPLPRPLPPLDPLLSIPSLFLTMHFTPFTI